jgi:hypothetical protein
MHLSASILNLLFARGGWLQSTIGHGVRSSSATAYLAPEFVRRGNLHVLLHARATRLVGGRRADHGELMFGGVEFMRDGEPGKDVSSAVPFTC